MKLFKIPMTDSVLHSTTTLLYPADKMPKPETNKNYLRLYDHALCPFSTRARYAFTAKQFPYQKVEMNTQEKADWFVEANGGTVPLLETPTGEFLTESAILMTFAEEYAPDTGIKLIPSDANAEAKKRLM